MKSPIVSDEIAHAVGSIQTSHVIELYRKSFSIDVSKYFRNMDSINIYECSQTGYRFFAPHDMAGDDELYNELHQQGDWFYKPKKWEYEIAADFVQPGTNLLDIGCGHGYFLKIASGLGANAIGLEFSSDAVFEATRTGLFVHKQSIEDHAAQNTEVYDVVTSFQVLEHVPQVKSFLDACIKALKPGGKLIFGVPNNNGFLKFEDSAPLNMPPHHMGLWTRESLSALTQFFPIDLYRFEIEPLEETGWYQGVMERRYLKNKFQKWVYFKLGAHRFFRQFIEENAPSIAGHTVLVIFTKSS